MSVNIRSDGWSFVEMFFFGLFVLCTCEINNRKEKTLRRNGLRPTRYTDDDEESKETDKYVEDGAKET